MKTSEIKVLPAKVLTTPAKKISLFDAELEQEITHMFEVMQKADGVGLAAPQIGLSKRVLVCEYEPKKDDVRKYYVPKTVLINPKITKHSKAVELGEEGCLSVPDTRLLVPRYESVSVIGQDTKGERLRIRAKGMFARVLQHEIDHLDGKLIVDRSQTVIKTEGKVKEI